MCYPKNKANVLSDARIKDCVARYDAGSYTHKRIRFLRAVSHSVGVHAEASQPRDDARSGSDKEQAKTTATNESTSDASPPPVTGGTLESDCYEGLV